jgi:two-component system chemotaxis response regulator CheB
MNQRSATTNGEKIRVFIVDDSPLMCRAMGRILSDDPDIEVVGQALSGKHALAEMPKAECDVCTLDVHMPGMNGLTVLKHIMIRFPKPTLMVSAFTSDGSRVTFEALRYGAVDFFQKPSQ